MTFMDKIKAIFVGKMENHGHAGCDCEHGGAEKPGMSGNMSCKEKHCNCGEGGCGCGHSHE